MIAFRDFKPDFPAAPSDPSDPSREVNLARAVEAANAWIDAGSVEVFNVETLGTLDTWIGVRWLRVWYRTETIKPGPSPEV